VLPDVSSLPPHPAAIADDAATSASAAQRGAHLLMDDLLLLVFAYES